MMQAGLGITIMRKTLAGLMLPIFLLAVAGCGRGDAGALARLDGALSAVKASAESVLTGKPPTTPAALADLARRISAADSAIDAAQQQVGSLNESPALQAAALDYLEAVRGAVDQTRDRYATAIALQQALEQDRTVSATIGRAQDEAALELASADANAKAGAVDAAVSKAGNAVVEREHRLDAVLTALQRDAQPLARYALVSHDALAAAMASNVAPTRATPMEAASGPAGR